MAVVNAKTPFLTVDGVINIQRDGKFVGIVLIERKYPPIGLALPGGFVEYGESAESALLREMKEETGLDVIILGSLGIYSKPSRDPRQHTASAVFVCASSGEPVGSDDAKRAYVFPYDKIPLDKLVFDHAKIVRDFLKVRNCFIVRF